MNLIQWYVAVPGMYQAAGFDDVDKDVVVWLVSDDAQPGPYLFAL